jgi:hypothetical protein
MCLACSVCIATYYGLNSLCSIPGRHIFLYFTAFKPVSDSAQLTIQLLPLAPSPRVKRPGREADHLLSKAEIMKDRAMYLLARRTYGELRNYLRKLKTIAVASSLQANYVYYAILSILTERLLRPMPLGRRNGSLRPLISVF